MIAIELCLRAGWKSTNCRQYCLV